MDGVGFIVFGIFILILLYLFFSKSVRIVHQGTFMVVERVGKYQVCFSSRRDFMYQRTLKPGIHFIIPIIDTTRRVHWKYIEANGGEISVVKISTDRIDMREHVLDFGKQLVITKDNVIIHIDALVYFRITDPKAAVFNVDNLPDAVELLVQVCESAAALYQATLRNIVAKITLDDTFSSRETINEELLEKVVLLSPLNIDSLGC